MKKPNVLLIMADQWRGDCLGVAGHPDVRTPFLDSLANAGAYFPRALSAVPSCIAARAELLTGMSQERTGRVGYQDGVRWDYENTLPKCFTDAGYQTCCVGKMHVHPLRSRQGFEQVRLHDGFLHYYRNASTPYGTHQLIADDYCRYLDGKGHRDLLDSGIECNGWPARPWPYEEECHPTRWVGDQTADFLRSRDPDCPFFLTMSFVRPHPPLDPPESYLRMYDGQALAPVPVGDWAPPLGKTNHCGIYGIPDEKYLSDARRAYYALMTQIDHQIGRILELLGSENERKNTIVLFVSDHGEMLGDHHFFRKALPYEGSAHVPLILSGPGVQSQIDRRVCELRDIAPTLLALCGLPVPDTMDGENLLAPSSRAFIHGEHSYGDLSNHYIASDRDKYIWFSMTGREQYFDLSRDPREEHNAIGDQAYSARVAQMRAALVQSLSDREEGYVENGALVSGREAQNVLKRVLKRV